jgi:hypothetical protein
MGRSGLEGEESGNGTPAWVAILKRFAEEGETSNPKGQKGRPIKPGLD